MISVHRNEWIATGTQWPCHVAHLLEAPVPPELVLLLLCGLPSAIDDLPLTQRITVRLAQSRCLMKGRPEELEA